MQSVALRLIVEREREIEAFKPQEYWSVVAQMEQDGTGFEARLVRFDGEKLDQPDASATKAPPMAAKAAVEAGRFTVEDVETKPLKRNPAPPFTTSTLQQEAARKLGFSASHTMRLRADPLRGGRDHLHAYRRRADGRQRDLRLRARRSPSATTGITCPKSRAIYQTKAKNAQEAHEAIRPTDFTRDRAGSGDEAKLYDLIFKRAMASQMAAAQLERTTVTLRDADRPPRAARHRAGGEVPRLPRGLRGRAATRSGR